MEERYKRNVPAISEAECALLQTKRAAIVGCGGLGGHLIDQLARIGVGALVMIDGDVFEESNLNRQLLANTETLGQPKAEAALAHVRRVNPSVQAEAHVAMLMEENAARLIQGADIVFDALDAIEARRILQAACAAEHIPLVYGAIRGWVAQAALILPGEPLLDILYPPQAKLTDKSVLAFTPAVCAGLETALGTKVLLGRTVSSGVLHMVDLLHAEYEALPLL